MKKIYFFALFILSANLSLNAQTFTNYTTANSNIPNDMVSAVAVDGNNNIWLATDGGVAKFDGTNWTKYDVSNSGLPNDYIISIAVDNSNNIWAGTDGDGVLKFDGTTWTTYNVTNTSNLCDNAIHYIASSDDGYVWFGSWGNGISRLKLSDTTWTKYVSELPSDGGSPASIYYIYIDNANHVWIATNLGLVYYDNSSFTTITTGLSTLLTRSIAIDANNNKYIGLDMTGVDKLDASNAFVANYDKDNGLDDAGVTDTKFDSKGNLWISQFTSYGPSVVVGGITKFNTTAGTGITYSETHGLNNEFVHKIAIDSDDNIWLATAGGLSKFANTDGINENTNKMMLEVYPNPVKNLLNIKGNISSGVIEITDISGKTVLTQIINSGNKINVETLIKGIYFIQIMSEDAIYHSKFIKE